MRGNQVSLKLNGTEEGTIEIPEEYDAFDEDDDYNLGFEAAECWFEVSNIAVYCEDAEANITPEPTPGETSAPSETPAASESPTAAAETPSAAAPSAEEDDGGMSPVVIIACVAAAAAVVAVIIVLTRKKK